MANFQTFGLNYWETAEDIWVHAAGRLTTVSIHVTFTVIVPGAYPGEAKMCTNVLKWRTFGFNYWETVEYIDGYMLRCV